MHPFRAPSGACARNSAKPNPGAGNEAPALERKGGDALLKLLLYAAALYLIALVLDALLLWLSDPVHLFMALSVGAAYVGVKVIIKSRI